MPRVLGVLLLALCSPALAASPLSSTFAYDAKAPLSLKELGSEKRGEVTVKDVTFQGSPNGPPVRAYLVVPPGKGPFAAVLFVHWLGDPKTTNRTEFLEQAVGLAGRGAVSLLVDAAWSQPKWFGQRDVDADVATAQRQVIDLLRAQDLLLSLPEVDPKRYAYVGHDYGAMFGVLAGAVSHRAKTYVFLAPTTHFENWAVLGPAPKDRAKYRAALAPLDPVKHVAELSPASVFFQFSSWDQYVPLERAQAFFDAAKKPKLISSYDSDHALDHKTGTLDRFNWLARELQLQR